jgi:hypothetical protein
VIVSKVGPIKGRTIAAFVPQDMPVAAATPARTIIMVPIVFLASPATMSLFAMMV